MIKKNILVYQDEGTDEVCVKETLNSLQLAIDPSLFSLILVDSDYLNFHHWENATQFLIIPGGRSLPYYKKLEPNANRKIIAFVNAGGNYLGICAGGYYGSALTEFEKDNELEVICAGPLNFFPGIARGSAYGLGKFRYESYEGAEIANINWREDKLNHQVFFNGGAYFVDVQKYKNTKVLANYSNVKNQPAAIIQCQIGQGKAILTGVHIEYSYRALAQKEQAKELCVHLKTIEKQRQELFKKIILRFL